MFNKTYENSISQVAKHLNDSIIKNGYGQIPNFLPDESIRKVIEFIEGIKKELGLGNFGLKEDKLRGTCIEDLLQSSIKDLMYETLKCSGIESDKSRYFVRVRANLSENFSESPYQFHFDQSFLTVAIPIIVPSKNEGGALLMVPNIRNKNNNKYFESLQRKIYESKLSQKYFSKPTKHKKIFYEKNNAFFFNGKNSLHATGPIYKDAKRIVVLLHSWDKI